MSSLASPTSSRMASPGPPPPRSRANRAALRDYYGLKSSAPVGATPEPSPQLPPDEADAATSEYDADNFDADAYVRNILATKHLDEILRIENRLISEIKSLEGEKNALVYDNYSKLITATDTIRNMRDNMGPMMPEDSSLNDDIAHIAQTAETLAMKPQAQAKKRKQAEVVKWVLDAPRRLRGLREQGKDGAAKEDWSEVKELLDKWEGIRDVEEVKRDCLKVMGPG